MFCKRPGLGSSVFKFKGLSGGGNPSQLEQVVGLLERGEVYFSKFEQLNDPFEYSCSFDFVAKLSSKKVYWGANQEAKQVLSQMSDDECSRYIEDIEQQLTKWQPTKFRMRPDGIFCTCSTWENHVLWSHYAENHTGIAIEIDPTGIAAFNNRVAVKYSRNVEVIKFYSSKSKLAFERGFSTKFADWSYEREVRFFGNAGIYHVDRSSIKSVTFGINSRATNWEGWKRVYGIIQSDLPNCKIYEIERTQGTYEFSRIEVGRSLPVL